MRRGAGGPFDGAQRKRWRGGTCRGRPVNVDRRLAEALASEGWAYTTYEELGLDFDLALAGAVCEASDRGGFSADAAELTKHIEKQAMRMVQEEDALALGTQLVKPVVSRLFQDSARARAQSHLYALNRYETGGFLGHHQDSVGSTVLVVTVSGAREFRVRPGGETASADQAEVKFLLEPGSVMILDGQVDPSHAVVCVRGPSVSAVYDVPDLLRN